MKERIKINKENLQLSYEHFESALNLLKDLRIESFVSRFYYGIIWFLDGIFDNLKGAWHKKEKYQEVFNRYKILEKLWEYFRVLKIAADYGYYDNKRWTMYEN